MAQKRMGCGEVILNVGVGMMEDKLKVTICLATGFAENATLKNIDSALKQHGYKVVKEQDNPFSSGWISVKDKLPPDDTFVLAYVNGEIRIFSYEVSRLADTHAHWWADEGGDFHSNIDDGDVTHWALLPQPPK